MNVFGIWDITVNAPMGEKKMKLELKNSEEGAITGEFETPLGLAEIKNAEVDGSKLKFSVKPSGMMTVKVTADFDDQTISGHMKMGMMGGAKFTGVRVSS